MQAGALVPQGPYGYYLQGKKLYDVFHADYLERETNGWIDHGSHDSILETEDHADSYVGRRAVEWIKEITDDFPWHLLVSFAGPHDPFDPPSEYAKRYHAKEMLTGN